MLQTGGIRPRSSAPLFRMQKTLNDCAPQVACLLARKVMPVALHWRANVAVVAAPGTMRYTLMRGTRSTRRSDWCCATDRKFPVPSACGFPTETSSKTTLMQRSSTLS